jgi:hypothetical protein
MHDTTTFGPFVDAFLSGFRDEFPKLTALCFPLLSEHRPTPGGIDVDDVSSAPFLHFPCPKV